MTKIAAIYLTVAVVIDRLAAMVEPLIDQKHIAISARKKTADHGDIQIRSRQKQKRPIKASSTTAQRDASIIALRNSSSNTLLSARKEMKIQRQRQMTPLKA